jgi:lipoprotein-anchoring transpeptidase ErfK/SrfK
MCRFNNRLTLVSVMVLSLTALSVSVTHAGGDKAILVYIDQQRLFAFEDYKLIHEFDVVTGRPEKETMTGKFKITRKVKDYTSKKYDAPMPYSMFFSEDGKAIHGTAWATLRSYVHTYVTESVGSMGCVGLTEADAKVLFEWAPIGTSIVIVEKKEEEKTEEE